MSYLASDKIEVFPSAKRAAADPTYKSSRLIMESNLINLVNELLDVDSFVITRAFAENSKFAFNVHGYYFEVDTGLDITALFSGSSNTAIYANIQLAGTTFVELNGQDETSQYRGINFTATATTGSSDIRSSAVVGTYPTYSLRILQRSTGTSTDWSIPDESKVKYDTSSLQGSIDGGELE